jgi:hypothetical protein
VITIDQGQQHEAREAVAGRQDGFRAFDASRTRRRARGARSAASIAQRLVITERAVAKHTASIFLKLDLQPSDDDNRRVLAVLAYLGN